MGIGERMVRLFAAGAQNWTHFDRVIPRYVIEHLRALYALEPEALDSGELADALVAKIAIAATVSQLADRMQGLLTDGARRAAVNQAALRCAAASSFAHAAEAYLEAAGLR